MDEDEFFARNPMRPWTRFDSQANEPAMRALWLGKTLWGDVGRMTRQLLATSPEIPAGLGLPELRMLEGMLVYFGDSWPSSPGIPKGAAIVVSGSSYTIWQARYKIVLRAIDFLERR